jgi:hypothetical protein
VDCDGRKDLLVGDVDGDLRPDVIATGGDMGGYAVLRNRCLP